MEVAAVKWVPLTDPRFLSRSPSYFARAAPPSLCWRLPGRGGVEGGGAPHGDRAASSEGGEARML